MSLYYCRLWGYNKKVEKRLEIRAVFINFVTFLKHPVVKH